MKRNTTAAAYIFPKEVGAYIGELSEMTIKYNYHYMIWDPLRDRAWRGEALSPEEVDKKEHHLSEMHKIGDWFIEQSEKGILEKKFKKYIDISES